MVLNKIVTLVLFVVRNDLFVEKFGATAKENLTELLFYFFDITSNVEHNIRFMARAKHVLENMYFVKFSKKWIFVHFS